MERNGSAVVEEEVVQYAAVPRSGSTCKMVKCILVKDKTGHPFVGKLEWCVGKFSAQECHLTHSLPLQFQYYTTFYLM